MTMNDQAARERIVNDLDTTLFVEAGAGTGKTTALVGRVTALVKSGVPVNNLVVITFTRAAAAELRPTAAALAWRAAAFSHAEKPMAIPMPDDGDRAPQGPPV